jgi:LPS sulfotransferase NodH
MLISFLNSHPEIEAKGELLARLKSSSYTQILERNLRTRPATRAVGFKLFYYHPMDHGRNEVWEDFAQDRCIRIIHLKRRNVLRTCVSRAIAEKQDTWAERETKRIAEAQSKAVTISYDDLKATFEQTEQWEEAADLVFCDHPCLNVFYEELVESPVSTFRDITAFLDVTEHIPTTDLRKQNFEPTSQLIVNYSELRDSFRETRWQRFFDE